MLILITICRIVDGSLIYVCLSAYLQSLFLAARLVLIPFESQQEGTSADHIRNWSDDALDFFHSVAILCTNIFLRDRLPAFIATQFCIGEPLWVRRSPHSTCVDCVYLCFYYVFCMGGSVSKPLKRSPHMCLWAKVHQPKLSPLFALAPRALMVGPIPEHSF